MTRWKVGEFDFDSDTRRLRSAGGEMILEPKTAALLAYFCQHPGRSIGRDELLKAVWYGQVVSDNSINRVIVLLRKAFEDEGKIRRYIATIPKLGYRLIAAVEAIDESGAAALATPIDAKAPTRLSRPLIACAALIGVATIAYFLTSQTRPVMQASPSIVPLSRLAMTQFNADLAGDGETLLYTASDQDRDAIYQVTASGAEPTLVSAPGGHANFAKWAHRDAFAVYQFMDGDRCEFHRIERTPAVPRVATVLYECTPNSYTELSFSVDNSTLYFVERLTSSSPYAVYALDLQQRTKRRLSQPVARGYGNHYVDVHPITGALLILSDHAPGKTSVYELDPVSDSFTLRRAFDYSLDSAIWSHTNGSIVHPSKHPSYQLLETQLDSGTSTVVVSDSRRISSPRRIRREGEASRDYLFTSYLVNREIEMSQFPDARLNSAVMDYLPAISSGGDQLAFISKRSGYSQIWIWNARDDSLRALEPPDTGRRFFALAWSADDTRILANTNTGVFVYSLTEDVYSHDIALPLPAYAVHWYDRQTLSYSHYEEQHWHAYRYDLTTGKTTSLDERWSFSLRNEQQHLMLDQSLQAFRDGQSLSALSACAHPVSRYLLRYQLDQNDIYCHARDARNDLLRFDADMNMTRLTDVVSRFEFFSVRDGHFAKTSVASAYSDIMRTQYSDQR